MGIIIKDGITYGGTETSYALGSLTLPTASWVSGTGMYTQTVTLTGYVVANNTKIDLNPSASILAQMETDGTKALFIENNNGVLTAYAIGEKPTINLTIQSVASVVLLESEGSEF